jgi:hypothetical protein
MNCVLAVDRSAVEQAHETPAGPNELVKLVAAKAHRAANPYNRNPSGPGKLVYSSGRYAEQRGGFADVEKQTLFLRHSVWLEMNDSGAMLRHGMQRRAG